MALRLSQPLSHNCSSRVVVSQAVFLGAISTMRVCWSVSDVSAYVLPGAHDVGFLMHTRWSQILHGIRMGHEDWVSGAWHTSLAHCSLGCANGAPALSSRQDWNRHRINIRALRSRCIQVPSRCADRQWAPELHQRFYLIKNTVLIVSMKKRFPW